MKFGNTSSPLILTLLASSLLVACNDSGSDPKLASTAKPVTPKTAVSGVALDGYLNNAKVCIDINRDLSCDSADGESVFTNEKGQYTLLSDGVDLSQYAVIVEVIPYQTTDMDMPNATLERAYVLSAPADSASFITPYTTVISAIASQQGLDYNAAKAVMSKQLNVDASAFERDYVAKGHADDSKLHLLAQSLTRIMQKGEQASVEDGVARLDVRKGVTAKLALLDLASLKTKTDKLVGTANDRNAIDKIADDYVADVTVSTEEVVGNEVLIIPPAPDSNSIKDAADTFDWSWVGHFRDKTDYEYSVDKGQTWQPVTAKPLSVGKAAYAIGDVQVRTKANINKKLKAGKPSISTQAFTQTLSPAAPNSISVDDANNQFDWDFVATIEELTRYEYSLDSGATWQMIEHKPQGINDIALAVGALQVRLAEFGNSSAGLVASSIRAFTVTPDSPNAPRINVVDDNSDIFGWDLVDGFVKVSDYEVYLKGTWQVANANPWSVGNHDYSANSIKVRVVADANNGRSAGAETKVTTAFTKQSDKPVAPKNSKVDDAKNKFDWDNLTNFVDVADYEISVDGGVVWNTVTDKPASISDEAYAAGKVCVRVTENAQNRHPVGDALCSEAAFTETPSKPSAPTNPIVNDALDTFDWVLVPGFNSANDYEINVLGAGWVSVNQKPYQLADQVYAQSSIQVRVKSDPVNGRPSGSIMSNENAFTVRPLAAAAPSNLVTDDTANTLDWTFVTGFEQPSFYEISFNSGVNWIPVTAKPVVIGDIEKSVGEVQLRVAKNIINGMPSGNSASNDDAYTQTPKLAAPTGGEIVNTFTGSSPIQTNGFKWNYLTVKVEGKSVSFDEPEYYEFTRDQGVTWHPVVSKPQFIGSEAYDKSLVGIRLKKDAIAGQSNSSSGVLWATNSTSHFIALKYVPMKTKDLPAGFSYNDSWNTYDMNCIAEYDDQGQGEPTFWAGKVSSRDAESVFQKVSEVNDCGISGWKLPEFSEVVVLSNRDADSLPSKLKSNLISNYGSNIWADKNGTPVNITKGVEVLPSQWSSNYAYPKWSLAPSSELLLGVNSAIASADAAISNHAATLTSAEAFLSTWLATNEAKSKNYVVLAGEAQTKLTELEALNQPWQDEITNVLGKLKELQFQATVAANRADAQSKSFVSKVESYKIKVNALQQNMPELNALIEGARFANRLANVQHQVATLTTAKETVNSASLAAEIHKATLSLYQSIFDVEALYAQVIAFEKALNTSTADLDSSFSSLLALYQQFISKLGDSAAVHDLAQAKILATDSLKQARVDGFSVLKADALVSTRFAKLDELGHYLPSATTFQQGWRCVEDTQITGKRRVWSLLKDGLPQGKDDIAYDASAAGTPSVLGSNEYLESANTAQLCGFSDWKVPHLAQLLSIKTKAIPGSSSKSTLDTKVFPNHLALLPEYDKSSYSGGTRFYYWSNTAKQSQQYVLSYDADQNSETTTSLEIDGSEDKVVLARLVREASNSYEFLDSNGVAVNDRLAAVCARDTNSGLVWQLFANADSTRFKKHLNAKPLIDNQNSNNVCGKSSWRFPSKDELYGLIPVNSGIFTFNDVEADYSSYDYYMTSDTGLYGYLIGLNMNTMSETSVSTASYSKAYLYRFVAK